MKASKMNPIYTTYIISNETGTKYNLTPTVISLDFSDQKTQLAQAVTIEVMNTKVGNQWLTDILKVRDRVFIYANDGTKNDEVFRGYVWSRPYRSGLTEREITLKCFDDLIYFQESQEAVYFSPGKSTEDVLTSICSNWGVSLNYQYESITHAKLALRGTLSDIITSDVLDLVTERTGKEYVILSEKGKMTIKGLGQNSTIYEFRAKSNAVRTNSECTMEGMVTKVVILGKAEDGSDREPVEATVEGNTAKYGTLQKILNRDQNTSLADAKKEAESIVENDGTPKWEYELRAPDVPWIRKGDKVFVSAGDIKNKYLIVTGVDRSIGNNAKEITLTLEPEKKTKAATTTTVYTASTTSDPETPAETPDASGGNQNSGTKYYTLSIRNSGLGQFQGTYSVRINGVLRYTGLSQDRSFPLKYLDSVVITPTGKDGHSFTITDNAFIMWEDRTVTIRWTR